MPECIGILAGGGQLPFLVADGARRQGQRVAAVGYSGNADPALAAEADVFRELKLGQLGKLIDFFKQHGVTRVVMAGTIDKPKAMDLRHLDLRALKLVFRRKGKGDDALLRLLSREFEAEGMPVVPAHLYMPDLLTPEGVLSRADVEFIGRIVCIDEATRELRDRYLEHLWASRNRAEEAGGEAPAEAPAMDPKALQFLVDQAVAEGVGAVIAVGVTREIFAQALNAFAPAATESIKALMGAFDFDSLERVLFYLLENQFLHLLRDLAAPEGGKLLVRSLRLRRTPQQGVEELFAKGLTKIRKAKIWSQDPARPDMLVFRQRTGRELAATLTLLQMEETLSLAVLALWEAAGLKIEAVAQVDLEMVSRTTTNMRVRLAEILGRFGIHPGRKEPAAEPAAEPEAGGENPA